MGSNPILIARKGPNVVGVYGLLQPLAIILERLFLILQYDVVKSSVIRVEP